ncbi:TniQ family protein [Sulfitobacter guttiformis]|uniref:TniQ family protein n=1 Tax=Sulfitobacter guttiformis TaxID=74349 RepID=UPI001E639680|nr:TniQ family protein [Sulfitobacter guttiformis]
MPIHRETILSFLSRIAAINGVSAADLAMDMGFSIKKIINLEENAVRGLAECGGLTDEQIQELVSWTGQAVGGVRMAFRDEIFVSRAVRNPIMRGCPICLREDASNHPSRPISRMAMRGDWQLRELNLCIAHQHPIVPLWKNDLPTDRFDISKRLAEILPAVLEGGLDQLRVTPSPYDLWLSNRLDTGLDDTWLADKSLYAATTFCKLLGVELQQLQSFPDEIGYAVEATAHDVGFDVASQGEVSIRAAFNSLAARADGQNDEPKKAFGKLYSDLSQAHVDKHEFAPFRKLLRDCIIDIWPVAADENMLGVTQKERLLHSIKSAAQETGIGAGLLDQFLVHAGAISAEDKRPAARKTFDAKAYQELLAEIPTLVGSLEMQQRIGATQHQLASLAEDKVLRPRIDIPTIKAPWRVADGMALIAELHGLASSIQRNDRRWETIQMARRRSDLSVGTLIAAARSRQLQVGHREDLWGYAGFSVLKSEVDALKSLRKDQQEDFLISAAAFARSVGMRREGWFEKFMAAGHITGTRMPHPKIGGMRIYISKEDIAEFHARFVTASTMEREFGLHKRTLLARLKAAHVKPFAPNAQDFGTLYLREDVEAVIKPARIVSRK